MRALSEIRCVQSEKIGEKCVNDCSRQTIYKQLGVGLRDRHNNAALAYFRVYWLLDGVFGWPFVTLPDAPTPFRSLSLFAVVVVVHSVFRVCVFF